MSVLKNLNPETNETEENSVWSLTQQLQVAISNITAGRQRTPDWSHDIALRRWSRKISLYSLEVEAEACTNRMS